MRYELGSGVLNWPAEEHQTGRYGCISLSPDASPGLLSLKSKTSGLLNKKGRLVAIVQNIRPSWTREAPTNVGTPSVGEEVVLGTGTLFYHATTRTIGLRPNDAHKDRDWLSWRALFRTHNLTVMLVFEHIPCRYCGTFSHHLTGCPVRMRTKDTLALAVRMCLQGEVEAYMLPSKRGPHSDNASYLLGWNRINAQCGHSNGPRMPVGTSFTREVPADTSIDAVRAESLALFGREIHIKWKIGPWNENTLPIAAVDDPYFEGTVRSFPHQPGHYLIHGYFK